MPPDLDLSQLSDADKDALIKALFERLAAAERRIAELEAQLREPPKTPDNSSLPPSKGQKANRRDKPRGGGPRQGSLGREGGVRLHAFGPCIRVRRGVYLIRWHSRMPAAPARQWVVGGRMTVG